MCPREVFLMVFKNILTVVWYYFIWSRRGEDIILPN